MRTKEDIKANVSMMEIVAKYGFQPNRAGFIHCPFHEGDRGASLKIYADSFYCFGCGAHGDIFDFIMSMDGISFKEAYLELGGEYERPQTQGNKSSGFARAYAAHKRQTSREDREKKAAAIKAAMAKNSDLIDMYRQILPRLEPLSGGWGTVYNALQIQMVKHSKLTGVPYDVEVIRLE